MAYQATLPWANSRHYVTTLDGAAIERPDDQGKFDIKPWETEVLSFNVNLYVHTQQFSASIEAGVEAHSIYVILSKANSKSKKWRIDSIDSESLSGYENMRSRGAISEAIFKAITVEMWRRGLDPTEVMGWRRYNTNWNYDDIRERAMSCK